MVSGRIRIVFFIVIVCVGVQIVSNLQIYDWFSEKLRHHLSILRGETPSSVSESTASLTVRGDSSQSKDSSATGSRSSVNPLTPNASTQPSKIPITTPTFVDTKPPCGYLIRRKLRGRLGNQLFKYASFYGMIRRHPFPKNKTALIDEFDSPSELRQVFENLSIAESVIPFDWLNRTNFSQINGRRMAEYDARDEARIHACDGRVTTVGGWRQSYKYFYNWSEDIRREFTFKKEIREKASRMFADLTSNHSDCATVGVHLRRGDFTDDQKIKYGHWPAQPDYLKKAVAFFEKKLYSTQNSSTTNNDSCVLFLVFGDSLEWNMVNVKKLKLKHKNDTVFKFVDSRKSTVGVDLSMMGMCDHMIITSGTFSWWAGFFSRGIVTYQLEFARVYSYVYNQTIVADFFMPHWIGL